MEQTILEALQSLGAQTAIGGVSVMIGTYVFVQALKSAKLVVTGDQARLANVIVSLILGLLIASFKIFPAIEPVATTIFVSLVGSIGAAIVYNKLSETQDSGQAHPEG